MTWLRRGSCCSAQWLSATSLKFLSQLQALAASGTGRIGSSSSHLPYASFILQPDLSLKSLLYWLVLTFLVAPSPQSCVHAFPGQVNTLIISNVVLSLVVDLFVETKESLGAAGSITEEMAQLQERYAALGSTMSVSRKAGTSDRVFSTMFRDRVKELTIAQTPTASGSRPTVFRSESSP